MIAPITTVFLSLLAFVAAQADTDGATDSASAFVFAPTSTASVPTGTPSSNGPLPAPMTPVIASSESNLNMPTSSPSATPSLSSPSFAFAPTTASEAESSPSFAFAPTTTSEAESSPSFAFAPTTASEAESSPSFAFAPTTASEAESSPSFAFAPTTSSMEFSFQPQTQSQSLQTSAPPPQNPATTQTPEPQTSDKQNTAIIASSETHLEQPTTTPEFTYAPSTTPTTPAGGVLATTSIMSFTYNPPPPASTPTTPGNPVEQHPKIEQPGSSLLAPSPIIASTQTYLAQPSKSTITASRNYKTIHVTQASNGNFLYGSHTLTNGAEITQGANPKFPTQIIELQSSSQLVIENASTTRTQDLPGGHLAVPTTLTVRPLPPAYGTQSIPGGGYTLTVRPLPPAYGTQSIPGGGYILSAAAEQEFVTLNGHTIAVNSIPVPTEKAITYKSHTVSMGGLTLAAQPTATATAKSSAGGAEPSESSKPKMADSGVGRVSVVGSVVGVVGGAFVALML
ncbi:hypothetical protein AC578_1313 [Pseudocercospora eumusae]|uniref:REJ domain-containing protein n=1 Tax=Pseudocercospora eumusae TaxID=321146 RepID=A0A139HU73_9PEZI|nr:hypothetical protein AC578_1313 [Pseudocercospora eumusae]